MPESDEPLWGEFWKKEELLSVKASLPVSKWNAQWMQNPTAESGSIVKREWWQKWEQMIFLHVTQSYNPMIQLFLKKKQQTIRAITTWGIFDPEDGTEQAIILLDANRYRVDFPELKKIALEEYKYWEPDIVLIEAKASGTPLTHELRRMGIPVQSYSPSQRSR